MPKVPYTPHAPIDTIYRVDQQLAAELDLAAQHVNTCGKCRNNQPDKHLLLPCIKLQVHALAIARWWARHSERNRIVQDGLFGNESGNGA